MNEVFPGVTFDQALRYEPATSSWSSATDAQPGEALVLHVTTPSTWTPPLGYDPVTRFVYDGDGGRVKSITPAGTTRFLGEAVEIAPSGIMTQYLFIGGQRIAAIDRSPQVVASNSDLRSSPSRLARWWQQMLHALATLLDLPSAEAALPASSIRFYHGDHLGSTNLVTDGAGQVVEWNEHTPYGSLSHHEGSTDVPQKFTGQRLDASTGLYFYHARYYDPSLGRFISPDPIVQAPADPQTLNRYAYVRNNPVRYVDPTGFGWKSFFKAVLGIALGVVIGVATAGLGAPIAVAVATGAFVGTTSAAAFNGVPLGQSLALGAVSGLTGGLGAHFAIGAGIVKGALIGAGLGATGGAASNAIVGANPVRGALAGGVGGLLLGGAGGVWNSGLSGSQQTLLGLGASTAAGAASSALNGGDPLEGAALGLTAAGLALGLNRLVYSSALSGSRNRVTIYRGVGRGHPGYEDAIRGIVKPWGGHENPLLHNEGYTKSEFTSWTTNRAVAEQFTEGKGIVLQMTVDKSKVIYSPDYYGESEVLIQGPVSGAKVNYIDKR